MHVFPCPQCTSLDGPGGNRTPPSPNCHLVHQPQNRPRWPPYSVGEVPQNGPFWSDRPPILTSFAKSNFSQAWQLAFVKKPSGGRSSPTTKKKWTQTHTNYILFASKMIDSNIEACTLRTFFPLVRVKFGCHRHRHHEKWGAITKIYQTAHKHTWAVAHLDSGTLGHHHKCIL